MSHRLGVGLRHFAGQLYALTTLGQRLVRISQVPRGERGIGEARYTRILPVTPSERSMLPWTVERYSLLGVRQRPCRLSNVEECGAQGPVALDQERRVVLELRQGEQFLPQATGRAEISPSAA